MAKREKHLTDIEVLFLKELERHGLRRGVDFACQYPLRYSFILDFAFPDQKIAIECDGEAFHPAKRDNFKNYILKKNGWKVFRFWGQEIHNDVGKCVNKIIKEIKKETKDKLFYG